MLASAGPLSAPRPGVSGPRRARVSLHTSCPRFKSCLLKSTSMVSDEAEDKSEELLFGPPLDGLIREPHGFNPQDRRASYQPFRGKVGIALTNRTPAEFFGKLLDKIREVHR